MTTKHSNYEERLIMMNKNRVKPLHFPKSDKNDMKDEEYQKFLKKYENVTKPKIGEDINLYEEILKPETSTYGLPPTIIEDFQEYITRNNILPDGYQTSVSIYVNHLNMPSKIKPALKDKLNQFLHDTLNKQ